MHAERFLCASLSTTLWIAFVLPAVAQNLPQDGIDRNLLERSAREREFHVRLQEDRPTPIPQEAPRETGLRFYLPTPGTELLHPEASVERRVPQTRWAPGKSVVDAETQLRDNQRRRQVELQTQTQNTPDPARQQTLQLQQLGFDRETRAQDLGSNILRESAGAIGSHPGR